MGGGCVADRVDEGIHEAVGLGADGLEGDGDRPAVEAGDREAVDAGRAVNTASVQGGLPRLGRGRTQDVGAEALLPRARARPAGDPPALGDFERAGRSAEVLGQHRPIGVVAHQHSGRAVTRGGLVGAGRQTVTGIGGHHERPATPSQRGVQRTDAGADGASEVES